MFAHFMWFFSDTAVDAAACPSKNCQKWNMSGIHFFSVSFQLNTIQQCQTEIIYDAIVLFYTMFAVWCQHENTSIMLFDFYLSFDLLLLFLLFELTQSVVPVVTLSLGTELRTICNDDGNNDK